MPKLLRLVRLEALDLQEDDGYVNFDELRFVVVLDGYPVKTFGWSQPLGIPKLFNDGENLSNSGQPFVFWSFADITVYDSDSEGTPIIDSDPDEWIQTVRIDHLSESPIEIGKESGLSHLSPGRSDCRYRLWFRVTDRRVEVDEELLAELEEATSPSEFIGAGSTSGDLAADKGDCKWICSIDGGGLRGIFPLRALEQLEDYYGTSCFKIFDMFAGTSTGAIIAGSLASGMPLERVIALYADRTMRRRIFRSNIVGQRHAFRYLDLRRISDPTEETLDNARYAAHFSDSIEIWTGQVNKFIRSVARLVMSPRYRKVGMKRILYQLLSTVEGNQLTPLRLQDCVIGDDTKDVLITAWDQQRSETTLFAAFHMPYTQVIIDLPTDPVRRRSLLDFDDGENSLPTETVDFVTGHYSDVLLKDAVEASASAPVYFSPRARFSDGGVGPYNNPSFIAAYQALFRSNVDTAGEVDLEPKYLPYVEGSSGKSGTVVWSFGTAYRHTTPEQEADTATLISGSLSLNRRTDTALYWLEEVLDSLMFGASQEQVFLCREVLADKIKYVRVNLGLSRSTLDTLSVPGNRDEILAGIKLDAVEPEEFDSMDDVAQRFALRARDARFGFESGGYELPDPTLSNADLQTYSSYVKAELQAFE